MNQKKKAKGKEWSLKTREQYYRAISQYFYEQRGAPLFLSSQELNCIADWEKMKIPLRVVLDGLKQALEHRRQRSGRQSKFFSLNQCHPFVLEAHKQHRERRIGGERGILPKDLSVKKDKIRAEINHFLAHSPHHLDELNQIFTQLRNTLSQGNWDEEYIEKAEAHIEEILVNKATSKEREHASDAAESEYGVMGSEEFERIVRLRLIKELRQKYRIPYISPFYF
ncbi:hypothetical protein ACFLT2_01405 [Acidobacteriota bacterium]